MKTEIKILFIIIIAGLSIMTISCDNDALKKRSTGSRYIQKLHTFMNFTAYTKTQEEFDNYIDTIHSVIDKYSDIVSIYVDGGESNTINKTADKESVEISDDLAYLINKCLEYSKMTSGAFDISIKPVFDLWEISKHSEELIKEGNINITPPPQEEIDKALELVNYKNISLKNNHISFDKKGMQILLGGAAKGFILEKIKEALTDAGLQSGLLEAGGDIIIFDAKPGSKKWKVGIKNPRPENKSIKSQTGNSHIIYALELENKTIVTSGDYEQYYIDNTGKIRHHIINPKTGYPAENVVSATVISNTILDSDILSTSIFIMGATEGTKLIESLPDTESLIITADDDSGKYITIKSSGFDKYIVKKQ